MRIDINISKHAVMEAVGARSAYLARTLGREDVAVVDSNSDVVDGIWLEGVTTVSTRLQEWSKRLMGYGTLIAPYQSGDFHGTLDMPWNFDTSVMGALLGSLHGWMTNYVMAGWLQIKATDLAGTYQETAAGALSQVEACLFARRRQEPPLVTRCGRRGNVATIVLHRDELLRDIQARSWVIGDATSAEAGHSAHLTQDVISGGNEQVSLRDIDLVWHELEDILFPYLAHDEGDDRIPPYPTVDFGLDPLGSPVGGDHGFGGVGRQGYDVWFGDVPHWHRHWPPVPGGKDYGVVDNAMPEQEAYEARLQLPEGLAESTVRYWRTLMHEYIVTQVLANWAALVNIDKHEALALKVAQLREQLAVSLSCRTKRVHRPMRPW